jgi:hypothetical protein
MTTRVTVENFPRAESDHMFAAVSRDAGGLGKWVHIRTPTPIDHQPIIRQNRDTLYSAAIVDVQEDARVTVPDTGDRYASLMVINQDHYANHV